MEQSPPSTRPDTAAELLDLLLRSRWFADSLFGLLLDQSREYLDRPAQEFAVALVEKRCLSPWQATELLAGRNHFYRGGYRLIEPLDGGDTVHFIAEQVRPSRLVILEVGTDLAGTPIQRAFEFESGWLLAQRVRDRQFHQELLLLWRAQIEQLLPTLDPPCLQLVSPDRVLVDSNQSLICLQPLGQTAAAEPEVQLLAAATERFTEFFEEAAGQIESVLWSPAALPAAPAGRSKYLPLLRKSPAWTTIEEQTSDLQWANPDTVAPETTVFSLDETQEIPQPALSPAEPVARRSGFRIWIATMLALATAVTLGWVGGRTWANRIRAAEGPGKSPDLAPPEDPPPASTRH